MDIEVRHLRAFVAVAQHRSFSAAAKELSVTQPALTRTIQQLEERWGTQLFERNSRMVRPTEVGAEVLPEVQVLLQQLEGLSARARGRRRLRVAFEWALPDPWSTTTIERFERDEGVPVVLSRHDGALSALRTGGVDLVLTRQSPTAFGRDLQGVPLLEEERVAAVSARSPLAERAAIDFARLADHPLVVNVTSGSTWPSLWPADGRPTRVVECGNYDEWLALVAADRGVGTTPLSSTQTHDHAGVRYLRLVEAPPVTLYGVRRRGLKDRVVDRFLAVALAGAPRV